MGGTLTDVERECVRRIAEAKDMPADAISFDTTLESIAMDSLDRVSLSFDLEEEYGVEIPESQLHQIVTVRDVCTAVQSALTKKQSAAAGTGDAA